MATLQGETYIHTYCFPPGTRVKGEKGEGSLIGVMRLWYREETSYTVLYSDGTTGWVTEDELLNATGTDTDTDDQPNGWEVIQVPERLRND